MPSERPDFGQLVEYVTTDGIHRVALAAHALDVLPTLEAVRADYDKVAALGRPPVLDADELAAVRAAAPYHADVIANEITSSDPALVVARLAWVRSHPEWHVGANVALDDVYFFDGNLYRCVLPHRVDSPDWTPPNTPNLWVRYYTEEWPQWVQPAGAHDAYPLGAKVTHNGFRWTSDLDANVWEPGVYGWTQVV